MPKNKNIMEKYWQSILMIRTLFSVFLAIFVIGEIGKFTKL